jgi:hypothetical protein
MESVGCSDQRHRIRSTCRVEPVGEEEISHEIQKGLGKRPNFSNGQPYLFEADGGIVGSLGNLGPGSFLLE